MPQARATGALMLMISIAAPAYAAELVAPYVNTVTEDVALMLEVAAVGPDDYLIDLGAGDGRIVIAAALRGARAHGVELQPQLVVLARENAAAAGVADRVRFLEGDIFAADLTGATVVTAYLFPEANLALRPKLLAELPPGTRVVSNAFDMGDWQPDRHEYGRTSGGTMLWIIPSRVQGHWQLTVGEQRLNLAIEQHYQKISVVLDEAGSPVPVVSADLSGRNIEIAIGGTQPTLLTGSVEGAVMSGTAAGDAGAPVSWRADRSDYSAPTEAAQLPAEEGRASP